MIDEKKKSDIAMWVVYILIALMFGAFLGSPVPDIWAGKISEAISALPEQTTEAVNLHSSTAEEISAAYGIADSLTVKVKAGDGMIVSDLPTMEPVEKQPATALSMPEPVKKLPVLDPPVPEPAEDQPNYIVLNANRGGIADRKEMDVLIRLINAEAYGLSYKAKVAVGQVVMNRWTGPYYGDDLLAIMTAPYQFTPIHNGSAYKKKIEPDSVKAANAVLAGTGVKELTDDTYYFVDPDFTEDKTIETKMQFVCEIEGIHFFRPPDKNTH